MSLAGLLIHTCTIERDQNGVTQAATRDAYQGRTPNWQTEQEGVLCRLVSKSQKLLDGLGELQIVTNYTLLVSAQSTVQPGVCRITNITDRAGNVIEPGPFRIVARLRRADHGAAHLSLPLELQGGRHAA